MNLNWPAAFTGGIIGAFTGGVISRLSGVPMVWYVVSGAVIGFLLGLTEDI